MKTIWKYGLGPGINNIELPQGATFLDLQIQDGVPTAWFEVDSAAAKTVRRFTHVQTGAEVPADGVYLGTLQVLHIMPLVIHFYELK